MRLNIDRWTAILLTPPRAVIPAPDLVRGKLWPVTTTTCNTLFVSAEDESRHIRGSSRTVPLPMLAVGPGLRRDDGTGLSSALSSLHGVKHCAFSGERSACTTTICHRPLSCLPGRARSAKTRDRVLSMARDPG